MKRILILAAAVAALLTTDAPVDARYRMSFVPGRHGYLPAPYQRRHGGWRGRRSTRSLPQAHGPASKGGADEGVTVPPSPGSGFKMEDGVLTYPAPARFRNLKPLK